MAHCFTPIRGRRMRVTKVNALGRPVFGPAAFVTTSGFVSVQFSPEIEEGEETTVKTASGEICQPGGTLVRVVDADGASRTIPIEQIVTGQQVLSWASAGSGGVLRPEGSAVTRVGRRDYEGDLVTVTLPSGASSSYTHDHRCLAVAGEAFDSAAAVYIMRRGGDYRIGWTSRGDGSRNSAADTLIYARGQSADAVWMLSTHTSDGDAALTAAITAQQFSMPGLEFVSSTEVVPLDEFWAKAGSNRLDAARCVAAFGRDIAFPLWSTEDHADPYETRWLTTPNVLRACNLATGMGMCEVQDTVLAEAPIGSWRSAVVGRQPFAGTVYSLDVAGDHTYVADGIVTSNCVSEKACDELKWITVQIDFCQVDPCLFTLINETWTELRDCVGDVVGWAESHKFSCDTGFAMELWTDVTGYTPTTPGATGAWGYMLLPFIVGGTLGEQTIENGAVTFQITGRTKKGSNWGVGPYDVMCNDASTGACGPLLTPVGVEEPRRIFLTTCPPPPAICGCQPLSSPDGPPATVVEDTSGTAPAGRMGVIASIPAGTVGAFRVSWGDGTPVQDLLPGSPVPHTYTRAGTYNVSVWDSANTQKVTVTSVKVPFTGAVTPVITVAEEPPAAEPHKTVRATVTNPSAGRSYEVQWEAGGTWAALPTTGTTPHSAAHEYTTADGQKAITVRDIGEPAKSVTETITIPWPQVVAPVLAVTEDPVATAPYKSVRATVTNPSAGRSYEVQWEAGGTWAALPTTGSPAHSATHTYTTADGQKVVTVRDAGDTTKTDSETITIPWPQPVKPILVATEAETTDATRRTTRVSVTNPQSGKTYEVTWDGGTNWAAMAVAPASGLPSATHQTPTGATQAITVREQGLTTNSTDANVALPYVGPPFTLAKDTGDATGMTATATVTTPGTATYDVAWTPGTWVALAANTSHQFPTAGTYTVGVRDQATQADVATRQVTVPFPAAFAALSDESAADGASTSSTDTSTTKRRTK